MQHFHKIGGLSVFIPEWTIQRRLSEQSFSMLNWQAAERSAVVGTWNSFYQYLCISTPLRSKLFQDLTTGGPFRVMLLLRHFHVKSVWASLSLMQTISTTFFSYVTQFTNFFWVLVFFIVIIRDALLMGKERVYTYTIEPLHQAIVVGWGWLPCLMGADSYGHHRTVGLHQRLVYYNDELMAKQEHQQGSRQEKSLRVLGLGRRQGSAAPCR